MDSSAPLAFDIGLHKGEDTAAYLERGFRVVAFEADPQLAAHCRDRFADAIREGRLTIVEGAIAPAAMGDSITFFRNLRTSVWGTISPDWVERNSALGAPSEAITVPRVDMVECLGRFGVPDIMKIDIEGADRVVLDALAAVPERPRHLSIEAERGGMAALEAELRLLASLGYRRFCAVQQMTVPGLFQSHLQSHATVQPPEDPAIWVDLETVLDRYRRVMRMDALCGDAAPLRRLPGGGRLVRLLELVTGRPLPGWYDTHARLD